MLSVSLLSSVKHIRSAICTRNIGILAPALQKCSDPIQQLFVDKIREYKSKSTDGKLVDPTPQIQQEMNREMEKLAKMYGGTGKEDMTAFPKFEWKDPVIGPINQPIGKDSEKPAKK